MKRNLLGFLALTLLMFVTECPAGSKSTSQYKTFYVSCIFESGDYIDGSPITIDTVHGNFASADLVLYDPYGREIVAFAEFPGMGFNGAGDVELIVYGLNYPAMIVLTLPVTSLKKYAGGTIIALDGASYSYWEDGSSYEDFLVTGTISP